MRCFVLTIAVVCLATSASRADLIVNGSFENPAYDPTWITNSGGSFPFPNVIPPGWQGSGEENVNRPSALAFPGGVPDGLQTGVVGDDIGPGILY
jgi:hypothetical protein